MRYKIQKDRYYKSRGSNTKLYQIKCSSCMSKIAKYQKDGPGILKRLYLDRIFDINTKSENSDLYCDNCDTLIRIHYIYKPEKRPAYRLFVGAISKSIIK